MKKIKFPNIKKDIGVFLSSEEAKIVNKKVLKVGLGLAMAAGMLAGSSSALAQHTNYFSNDPVVCGVSRGCHASAGVHASHASHASY